MLVEFTESFKLYVIHLEAFLDVFLAVDVDDAFLVDFELLLLLSLHIEQCLLVQVSFNIMEPHSQKFAKFITPMFRI